MEEASPRARSFRRRFVSLGRDPQLDPALSMAIATDSNRPPAAQHTPPASEDSPLPAIEAAAPQQQDDQNWLWSCRKNHNYLRVSHDSLEAGVVVNTGRLFIWGGDLAQPQRQVPLVLQVDGKVVFEAVTTADMEQPLLDTQFALDRFRSLIFRAGSQTVQAVSFENWKPFPEQDLRSSLREELLTASENQRSLERLDRQWTDLPQTMDRLDREPPGASQSLPAAYLRLLRERFGANAKLSPPAEAAKWIFSDVLEDSGKRSMFFLTKRLLTSLTESMFNKRVLRQEISLALFSFWRRHYSHIDIFSPSGLRTVQYKFATAPFILEKNNRHLVTRDIREKLSAPADPYRQNELPWSWYWLFLHEDQQTAKKLQDPIYTRTYAWREVIADLLQPTRLSFNPPAWRSYWLGFASDRTLGFTKFDLALISLLADVDVPESAVAAQGAEYWSARLLREVYQPLPELGQLSGLAEARTRPLSEIKIGQRDLAIIGHFNNTGLGRNFKMFMEAFAELEPLLFNADDGSCLNPDPDYIKGQRVRAKVVILCVNADRVPDVVARLAHVCEGAHLIGFYLWETDTPPQTHLLGTLLVDEIWAPSSYIAEAYRKLTTVPIEMVRKGLKSPPSPVPLSFARSEDKKDFIFLTLCEFGSGIIRKNPRDVVYAFQHAFTKGEAVQLWLKVRRIEPEHWSNQGGYWEDIEELMAKDPRIQLVEGDLSDDDYWALLRHVDVFVSLHMAEGFGYGLADALLCGTPVITADYSGSTDFCDDTTAFLVPVDIEPVSPQNLNVRDYIGNWARPNVEAASEAMQTVYNDPDAARARAAEGLKRIRETYDFNTWRADLQSRVGKFIDQPPLYEKPE